MFFSFTWLWLVSIILIFSCFSTVRSSFISVVIFIEIFNVFVLLFSFFMGCFVGGFLHFITFIIVATMEVVLSLVSLTRLWCLDTFVF
uniref:NADH dehydrogenase subunit 4L n=1 Tax=Scutogyrus longicornis TaxID=341066 RepID=A0A888YSJ5_9PLAT|nr:NADH dehydrogenase subunit 4L [Scutogyrus longicornis]QRC77978.1 NADH dehydrogenase subunit 4L [Scutogyrus longicornis]